MSADVFIFNASNDDALAANTVRYQPNKTIRTFEADLSLLPMLFAKENDIVLVNKNPDNLFLNHLSKSGIAIPTFVEKELFFKNKHFKSFQIHTIKPWGWSQHTHFLFRDVIPYCTSENKSIKWNINFRDLCGRHTAALMFQKILAKNIPQLIGSFAVPKIIRSVDEYFENVPSGSNVLLKSPWSSSGRGLMHIVDGSLPAFQLQWLQKIIENQGFVMLEPWHKKLFDFSLLFTVEHNKISFLNISTFKTNNIGKYEGSYLHIHNDFREIFPFNKLEQLVATIIETLESFNITSLYNGWLGIDAMIVEQDGNILIHPCVELNCRYTMGHVASRLANIFPYDENAFLKIGTINEYKQSTNNVLLTPIYEHTMFVAWVDR